MRSFFSVAVLALVTLGSSDAFAPSSMKPPRQSTSAMEMSKNSEGDNGAKGMAAAAIASACIMSSLFTADAAFAEPVTPDFGGSTMTIAGRSSGGRAGGRASSGGVSSYRPSAANSGSYKPSNTVIEKRTVIQQSPTVMQSAPSVIVAPPPVMGYGYGYSSGPGFGTIATLGAIDAIGDAMREGRQNAEIRNTREQLQQERMKEFELEQRLKMVEMQQMQQAARPMQQMAPMPVQQMAAPVQQ